MRKLKIVLVGVIVSMNAYAQQVSSTFEGYLPRPKLTSYNVFFIRSVLNPSLSNDTFCLHSQIITHDLALGAGGYIEGKFFTFFGHMPQSKSMFGIIIDQEKNNSFKNQEFRVNYSYKFGLTDNSDISLGSNVLFSRSKYTSNSTLYFAENNNWFNDFNIDIGLSYRFHNQVFGVSYLDPLDLTVHYSNESDYTIARQMVVFNYLSSYNLNEKLKISPELLLFHASDYTRVLLKGIFTIKDRVTAGFSVDNKFEQKSFIVSCILFKHYEIGQTLDFEKEDNLSSTIKLGVRF